MPLFKAHRLERAFHKRVRERELEAETIIDRIRLHIMNRFEIDIQDENGLVIDAFALDLKYDQWTAIRTGSGYFGDLKMVGNGGAISMHCAHRWLNGGIIPAHTHPHDEHFIVQTGKVVLTTGGTTTTYRANDYGFMRANHTHSAAFDPGTQLAIVWFCHE